MKYVPLAVLLGCAGGEATPSAGDSGRVEGNVAESSRTTPASRYRPGSIILFAGTSLTAGYGLDPDHAYPELIQRKIDSAGLKFDVVNAGVSGETSSGLLRRLRWLLNEPFEIIVIETGANDGLRGIPIETMAGNIQQIIDGVRAVRPRAQIMLVQMEAPPNLGGDYTRRFHDVFPELAKRNDVILLPFLLDNVAGFRALNQSDGMHPNEEGERIVAENVWRALRPLLQ
jgi:acyl-CoA thioesterase-1